MDKPLELDVSRQEEVWVIRIVGSVGMNEADQLRAALEEIMAEPARAIVLDLSGMDFICSLGLGAMIAAHQKMRGQAGDLKLVNPQPPIREVLEATRLTKLFAICSSIEEAVS
jgi:anti-anti-sigma factor